MNMLISSILFSFILWSPVDMLEEAEDRSHQHCLDHKGQEVPHGDRFSPLANDSCTRCTCLNGKPQMCTRVQCSLFVVSVDYGYERSCLDHKGKRVPHGVRFSPSDPCIRCTCLDGRLDMCIAVMCAPPEGCQQYRIVNDTCCESICIDGVDSNKDFGNNDSHQHCLDNKGQEVSHDALFFPLGKDPCTRCTCLNGKPQMCTEIHCSPPEHCKQYRVVSDTCCEYICLDGVYSNKDFRNDTRYAINLGSRLVTSPNTSFLISALLMFMRKWSL